MLGTLAGLLNAACGGLVGLVLFPFRPLGPWPAMIAVSLLTGLLMLFIFKKTSNQAGIRRAKDRIKAHLLEIRLYRADFGQTMRSQGKMLLANGRYVAHALKPMLVMFIPILLLLLQLDSWFGARALRPGETAMVKVKLDKSVNPMATEVGLEAPAGAVIETPPLRIEEENEVDWRIKAGSEGRSAFKITVAGETWTKALAVGGRAVSRIVPSRVRRHGLDELSHPGEPVLAKTAPVAAIEISYPPARMNLFGWRMHWLVAFFILSIVFGFGLKGVFKVEI